MTDQWRELKETIVELRDSGGTGTQQEVCNFLARYMDILEKQMNDPIDLILEIIDRKIGENTGQPETPNDYVIACIDIKDAVYALKDGGR